MFRGKATRFFRWTMRADSNQKEGNKITRVPKIRKKDIQTDKWEIWEIFKNPIINMCVLYIPIQKITAVWKFSEEFYDNLDFMQSSHLIKQHSNHWHQLRKRPLWQEAHGLLRVKRLTVRRYITVIIFDDSIHDTFRKNRGSVFSIRKYLNRPFWL